MKNNFFLLVIFTKGDILRDESKLQNHSHFPIRQDYKNLRQSLFLTS